MCIRDRAEAIKGADVFLGLSKGNVLTQDMVRSMADHPIVFALANPCLLYTSSAFSDNALPFHFNILYYSTFNIIVKLSLPW